MQEYLVFRLYGPMASWGQAAVGGDRPTGIQPTRSAILGLLGAALGIRRDKEADLQALQQSVRVAVKQVTPTSLLRDYHTTQVPSHSNKVTHRSRKSELSENKLNTILSSRDYRCDGLWVVAISLNDHTKYELEQFKQALIKPEFSLSLGRKSCPPSLPLMPKVISSETLKQALDTEFPCLTRSTKEDALWLGGNKRVTYFWEGNKAEIDSMGILSTQLWDEPVCRGRWQFKQRMMHQVSMEEG
ncbi:type I-E CRISPR-associated protein Cas5/CasD [Neptunicella sp.]|uniref:type I-E CRISPR-associated protein Cas5/CasD n=1 Tax=Neptunicella sp. TaxID=2125986 RepID=UPI003F691926